jgi:hypothetical protein
MRSFRSLVNEMVAPGFAWDTVCMAA